MVLMQTAAPSPKQLSLSFEDHPWMNMSVQQETCSDFELEKRNFSTSAATSVSRQEKSACRRREEAPTYSQFRCWALQQGQMFGTWERTGKILVLATLVWILTCLSFHTSFFTVMGLKIHSFVLLLVCFLYSADQELNLCIKWRFSDPLGTRTPADGCSGPWGISLGMSSQSIS